MRVVGRDEGWSVQYGYYVQRGSTQRFMALREWPAGDLAQAHAIAARENINVILSPPPDVPIIDQHIVARAIREAPGNLPSLVDDVANALPDPLPTVEESHAKLGIGLPAHRTGGYQFYVYLAEPIYGRLVAMAAAAGTTRDRMVEALILAAGEEK